MRDGLPIRHHDSNTAFGPEFRFIRNRIPTCIVIIRVESDQILEQEPSVLRTIQRKPRDIARRISPRLDSCA